MDVFLMGQKLKLLTSSYTSEAAETYIYMQKPYHIATWKDAVFGQ